MTELELVRLRFALDELRNAVAVLRGGRRRRLLEHGVASCLHAAAVVSYVAGEIRRRQELERRRLNPWRVLDEL